MTKRPFTLTEIEGFITRDDDLEFRDAHVQKPRQNRRDTSL